MTALQQECLKHARRCGLYSPGVYHRRWTVLDDIRASWRRTTYARRTVRALFAKGKIVFVLRIDGSVQHLVAVTPDAVREDDREVDMQNYPEYGMIT